MNLYRVVVLREDKENLERGVWADKMELKGESILFLTFDTIVLDSIKSYLKKRNDSNSARITSE